MESILSFSQALKLRNIFPSNIEFSRWHNWTMISAFDEVTASYISESVAMGVDQNPNVALAKAIVEYCERSLAKKSPSPAAKITSRSDGFAAYPVYNCDVAYSTKVARDNALLEAAERYMWSTWWDNSDVHYNVVDYDSALSFTENKRLMERDFSIRGLNKIIVPSKNSTICLHILLAETERGGYATGGAASIDGDHLKAETRAFGELLRHLIAINKMTKSTCQNSNMSFYERRLFGFGSGLWRESVISRLKINSENKLTLPDLFCDTTIEHDHKDIISIHRCLFKNQPPFMGGALERLCI